MVGGADDRGLRRGGCAAAGELAAEVEVLAVGLFQRVAQGLDFLAVLLFQPADLAGQGENEGVLRVREGRRLCSGGLLGLGSQAFNACAQVVVSADGLVAMVNRIRGEARALAA